MARKPIQAHATPLPHARLSTTRVHFNTPSSRNNCTIDARLVSKTRKYQQTNILRFVRMTFVYRLTFHTEKKKTRSHTFHTQKKKTRSHLAECESFKTRQSCQPILVQPVQCPISVKCISFNPSRASKRPTALVYEHSQVQRHVRIHQIRHRAVVGSSSNRKSAISQCLLGCSLHIACSSSSLFPVMVHPS